MLRGQVREHVLRSLRAFSEDSRNSSSSMQLMRWLVFYVLEELVEDKSRDVGKVDISAYFSALSTSLKTMDVDEWITFDALCKKYPRADGKRPICSPSFMHEAIRTAPDDQDFLQYVDKKTTLFNPKRWFTYISNNKRRNSRLYARLKKQNFFGLVEIKETK